MKELKALVIDDEQLIRWSFEKQLSAYGCKVTACPTGEDGLEQAAEEFPDIAFVDNQLPGMQGLDVITRLRELHEDCVIIFMTAYGSVDTAVAAIKGGAFEYLNKPFSFKEVFLIIDKVREDLRRRDETRLLKRQQSEELSFDHIISQSALMKRTVQEARKLARTATSTVLLLGESGTGKDLFARAIHNESDRASLPFVTINCSSLPETLLESELFGHEKGAFTDARQLKKGLFEVAEGGTVFLDEIGEIDTSTQVKLLGVVENRSIRRVGGTRDIPVDIRIIAATNKDLRKAVEERGFREDLYYRLKVFQIYLPPLREHREDIPFLADFFISLFNRQFRRHIDSLDMSAMARLKAYDWPGNVRELRNVIERAVILESGQGISEDSLPREITGAEAGRGETFVLGPDNFDLPEEGISMEAVEERLLRLALKKTGNNVSRAARLLDISRDTLRYKIQKFGL